MLMQQSKDKVMNIFYKENLLMLILIALNHTYIHHMCKITWIF